MRIIINGFIFLFIFCFFICIADCIQHYNLMPKIIYEFKLMEILNFLVTVFFGIFIPYYISKSLDNKKSNRLFLIDECKDMLNDIGEINNLLINLKINLPVDENNKNELVYLLEISEKKLDNLIFFLEEAGLPSDVYNSDDFKISFIKYWDDITGGELMSKSFIFSDEFRSLTTISFYDLEKHIKSYIVKLSKT